MDNVPALRRKLQRVQVSNLNLTRELERAERMLKAQVFVLEQKKASFLSTPPPMFLDAPSVFCAILCQRGVWCTRSAPLHHCCRRRTMFYVHLWRFNGFTATTKKQRACAMTRDLRLLVWSARITAAFNGRCLGCLIKEHPLTIRRERRHPACTARICAQRHSQRSPERKR